MSIEALLQQNIEAINRNTDALLALAAGGGKVAAATTEKPAGKSRGKAAETSDAAAPKVSQDEMQAALIKIKDDFGMDEAKSVIKAAAKVDKMGDIPADKYDAVYDAAVKKHAELTEAANAVSSDEGGL